MKIHIGGLSEGVHRYRLGANASELGLAENFRGEVSVNAVIEKRGNQLFLTAAIETTGTFDCDRCMTQFETLLSPSYKMNYLSKDSDPAQYDPAEVQVLSPGENVLDISEDVRQTILLSVPLKLLCRNDCAGLCPQCGRNLNQGPCACKDDRFDSRWEQLRRLQNR
jgi:uncharacterized protein